MMLLDFSIHRRRLAQKRLCLNTPYECADFQAMVIKAGCAPTGSRPFQHHTPSDFGRSVALVPQPPVFRQSARAGKEPISGDCVPCLDNNSSEGSQVCISEHLFLALSRRARWPHVATRSGNRQLAAVRSAQALQRSRTATYLQGRPLVRRATSLIARHIRINADRLIMVAPFWAQHPTQYAPHVGLVSRGVFSFLTQKRGAPHV